MKLVCRALLWRQTGRLLNRTDEHVCLYFTSACHCHVNLCSVIAPSAGQTQAGNGIVPPFCRISQVLWQRSSGGGRVTASHSLFWHWDRWALWFLTAKYASQCQSFGWRGTEKQCLEAIVFLFYSAIVDETITSTCTRVVHQFALNLN